MDEPLHPAQIAAYRRMTIEQKLNQAAAMYWSARQLRADVLRRANPTWSEEQIQAEVREIFLYATT